MVQLSMIFKLQTGNQVLNLNTDSVDGFSWGLGASYAFTDNVAIFVDYVSIYNDSEDWVTANGSTGYTDNEIDTWNFGVTYQF